MKRLSRRGFILALPLLPISRALADIKPLKIEAVEIWQFHGTRQTTRGVDSQYQANPLFIYDELRPEPYHDRPAAAPTQVPVNAFYVRIKTEDGLEGLYGPIEKEAAIVVDEQ